MKELHNIAATKIGFMHLSSTFFEVTSWDSKFGFKGTVEQSVSTCKAT